MKTINTLNSPIPNVKLCELNGWHPGTRLIGDEGYGPCTIRITAIGESSILAVCESHGSSESTWTLKCREWEEATE